MATQAEMSKKISKQIEAFKKSGKRIKKIPNGVSGAAELSVIQTEAKLNLRKKWYAKMKKHLDRIYAEHGDISFPQLALKLEEVEFKTKKGNKFTSAAVIRAVDEMGYKYVA